MSTIEKGMTPQEKVDALVEQGICRGQNHAAHFLYDMGEIDIVEHARLLTDNERRRVYECQEG